MAASCAAAGMDGDAFVIVEDFDHPMYQPDIDLQAGPGEGIAGRPQHSDEDLGLLHSARGRIGDRDRVASIIGLHDRAVLYHEAGQRARARREFERLYAADPGFEDVAERLGVGG